MNHNLFCKIFRSIELHPAETKWNPTLSKIQYSRCHTEEFEQLLVNADFAIISDIGFNVRKYSRARKTLTVAHSEDHYEHDFTLHDLQTSEYTIQLFVYIDGKMNKIL